jgi:hypothetical protein
MEEITPIPVMATFSIVFPRYIYHLAPRHDDYA